MKEEEIIKVLQDYQEQVELLGSKKSVIVQYRERTKQEWKELTLPFWNFGKYEYKIKKD